MKRSKTRDINIIIRTVYFLPKNCMGQELQIKIPIYKKIIIRAIDNKQDGVYDVI